MKSLSLSLYSRFSRAAGVSFLPAPIEFLPGHSFLLPAPRSPLPVPLVSPQRIAP
jgi:hypothetical protein